MPTQEHVLKTLLGDCIIALETLLASPDLNLDSLEPTTRDAIEHAHTVLQAVKAVQRTVQVQQGERRQDVHCVYCGKPIPGEQFTEEDRGTLVAYIHRACFIQAERSAGR